MSERPLHPTDEWIRDEAQARVNREGALRREYEDDERGYCTGAMCWALDCDEVAEPYDGTSLVPKCARHRRRT